METVTIGDKSMNCAQWAKELGVTRNAIYVRKKKYGETSEEAVRHFLNKLKYGTDDYRARILLKRSFSTLDMLVSDDGFLAKLEAIVHAIKTVREVRKAVVNESEGK